MPSTAAPTPFFQALFLGDARFLLMISAFISLLFLGGDILAVPLAGINIRLVSVTLMVGMLALLFNRKKPIILETGLLYCFIGLTIAALASCFHSYDPWKSLAYTAWVLFTFFVIVTLFYNFADRIPVRASFEIWLTIYRIHAWCTLGELVLRFAIGNPERPHLWFYETSYLAIFMTGYFAGSLYLFADLNRRKYFGDTCLAAVTLMALASATALGGLCLSTMMVVVIARRRILLMVLSLIFAGAVVAVVATYLSKTQYYDLVFGFLLRPDASILDVVARAGNRYPRFLVGWDAFLSHPWVGIGIGADEAYMLARPLDDNVWQYLNRHSEVDHVGFPFINITVEVMGSMGVLGLVPFLSTVGYASYRAAVLPNARSDEGFMVRAVFVSFFAIFLVLQIEASFLRYYLWSPLALALGMADRHIRARPTGEYQPP